MVLLLFPGFLQDGDESHQDHGNLSPCGAALGIQESFIRAGNQALADRPGYGVLGITAYLARVRKSVQSISSSISGVPA